MKVYAWRWPPATEAGSRKEADLVADKLIPKGLDGYIVDPESDAAGAVNDWNRAKCIPFAKAFCKIISDAAPSSFAFGTTSGCAYPAKNMKPNIPWAECESTEVLAVSIHLTELIRYMRQWNGKPSRSRCARTTKLRVLSSESVANRFRGRRADLDGSTRGNSDLDVRNCRHQGNWPPMARDKRQPCELQRCQR
jgi:hypothetical protein